MSIAQKLALTTLLYSALWSSRIHADTLLPRQQAFTVSAQIVAGCGVVDSSQSTGVVFGTMDFGNYPALATGKASASAQVGGSPVQIQCSPGTTLGVSIDGGLHASGAQRNLKRVGGTQLVAYQLYADAAHAQPIPVGQVVTHTVFGTFNVPVYGELTLPGPGSWPGTYDDTVKLILSY
jgi:spore coat protein U-like protein